MTQEIRIYVACLSAYVSGRLHGVWIDVLEGEEHIKSEISKMLAQSPESFAEEWAVHGADGFGAFSLSENPDLSTVVAYAEFISEHGEDLASAVLTYTGGHIDEAVEMMEDRYHGQHRSEAAFVEELASDIYEIPDYLEYYIDYEAMARDWFINDYLSLEVNGDVHVFSYS